MNRGEAIHHTLRYLTETDEDGIVVLNYSRMLTSLTEYAMCWYVHFCYQRAVGQLLEPYREEPGFVIDKQTKHIRVVSWLELYELNCEYFPY